MKVFEINLNYDKNMSPQYYRNQLSQLKTLEAIVKYYKSDKKNSLNDNEIILYFDRSKGLTLLSNVNIQDAKEKLINNINRSKKNKINNTKLF